MRVTVIVHESETLKGDKFVTGTANDGNMTPEAFIELLNTVLGKFSGILVADLEKTDVDPGPEA